MKKAKLLLTSIAIVAIVGIALAYKVSNDRIYIDTNGDGIADTFITGVKLTLIGGTPTIATITIGVPVVETSCFPTDN